MAVGEQASEPVFNVPPVVTALIAVMLLIFAIFDLLLSAEQQESVLRLFAFVPLRYVTMPSNWPGGLAGDAWTFVTYALLHGSWAHVGLNAVWLLAFGTPVARRFGAQRFLAFFAVTAAAGAAAHLAVYFGEPVPIVGASAAVSGCMAAAIRFAFQGRGPLDRSGDAMPALPLTQIVRNGRVMAFLIAWFALNLLFGLGSLSVDGSEQAIAWQAHIGGFLAGLFGFALFDPIKAAPIEERPTLH